MIRYGPSDSRVVLFMRGEPIGTILSLPKHIIRRTGFERKSMRALALPCTAAAILTLALLPARAAEEGGLAPNTVFVPWKILTIDDRPPAGELLLSWIPLSRDDFRPS